MSDTCCETECCEAIVTNVPGPTGAAGTNGTNGAAGVDAYTTVAVNSPPPQPAMPVSGATVVVNTTSSTAWMSIGQVLYVQNWGYLDVSAIPSSTSVTLRNLEGVVVGTYADNAGAGTLLAAASKIVPGGWQGPSGPAVAGALLSANNLNDLADYPTSRTNLGLGTMAVQAASGVAITGGTIVGITDLAVADGGTGASNAAAAQNNLGLVLGLDVQAFNALLAVIAALAPTVADRFIYTTGVNTVALGTVTAAARQLLDDSTSAAMRSTLGVMEDYGLLGTSIAANHNIANTDYAIAINAPRFRIDKIIVYNATANLTLATSGLFTAVGGGGTPIAVDQVLSALTSAAKFLDLTLAAITNTDTFAAATYYYRVGTPQGAAAVASVAIFGWKLA